MRLDLFVKLKYYINTALKYCVGIKYSVRDLRFNVNEYA